MDYANGAGQASGALLAMALAKTGLPMAKTPVTHDRNYLLLTDENFRAFDAKWWSPEELVYHGNSSEFPDCDDYARLWVAAMIQGAILEGLPFLPFCGWADVRLSDGGLHALGWGIMQDMKLRFREPQQKDLERAWTTDPAAFRIVEVLGADA